MPPRVGAYPETVEVRVFCTAILRGGWELAPMRKVKSMPEWLQGLVQAGLTVIGLIVIIMLLAALFRIIFGIATGIDDRLQD